MVKLIRKNSLYVKLFIAILAAIGGYALFTLARIGIESLLVKMGINTEAMQMLVIILFVLIIFLILGIGFRKTLKRLAGM